MIYDFRYNVDIEVSLEHDNIEDFMNGLESLPCNPSIITLFMDLIEYEGGSVIFFEENIDSDEDYSMDVICILDHLLKVGEVSEGSKFESINRSTITSVSHIKEDSEWNIYSNIDREYGYGSFEDDESEDW